MRITYFDIARFYLLLSFFIFPLSTLWIGPSLVLITDVLIIIVVLDILLRKRFDRNMKWVFIFMVLSLLQMVLIMEKYNGNIVIFLHSRSIFVYTVITFFYMYTFSKLDNSNLKKISYFIELMIKIQIAAIVADGIAINFFGMQNFFGNIFQSEYGSYRVFKNAGIIFSKIPNGLLFGAQHASILAVIGILWWLPGIKKNLNAKYLSQYSWLLLSFMALVFSITTTAIITLTMMLAITTLIILFKKNKITALFFLILTPFVIGISIERILSFFRNILIQRYRLSSDFLLDPLIDRYYSLMVEQPINAITKNYSDFIIGVGRLPGDLQPIVVTEIGFIKLFVDYGFFLIGILLFSILFYMLKAISVIIRNNAIDEESYILFRLILISLAILFSLIHYTTFLAPGVKQLFAAVIALSYVLIKKYKRIPKKTLMLA